MPETPRRSHAYRLVEIALDRDPTAHIATARTAGDSFERIAQDIYLRTGIRVTGETIRTWAAK